MMRQYLSSPCFVAQRLMNISDLCLSCIVNVLGSQKHKMRNFLKDVINNF